MNGITAWCLDSKLVRIAGRRGLITKSIADCSIAVIRGFFLRRDLTYGIDLTDAPVLCGYFVDVTSHDLNVDGS
jgi:hypothetical protein